MNKLITTKEIVAKVLERDFKARNDRTWLILQTLREMGFKIYIDYNEMKRMPSFSAISRSARYWQNTKHKFLPTQKTGIARDNAQEKYKEVFR